MAKIGVSRAAVEKAYAESSRAASRSSFMGALGFGIALVIGVPVVREGNLLSAAHGLELVLVAGGISGGIVFTVLALRASRMAGDCLRRLRGTRQPKRR